MHPAAQAYRITPFLEDHPMLGWLHSRKSETLEKARARARERARATGATEDSDTPPGSEGLVVEELSADEFLRLLRAGKQADTTP